MGCDFIAPVGGGLVMSDDPSLYTQSMWWMAAILLPWLMYKITYGLAKMWKLDDLIEFATHIHREVDGDWVPCRPEVDPPLKRLRAAWAVITGKADAVIWPNGQ